MRRIAAALLAVIMLGLLGGCAGKPAGTDRHAMVVGFSQLGAESSWRIANTRSVEEAAKRYGFGLMTENANQKQEKQIDAIRSFIAYRVDVIVSIGRLTENNLLSCMLCSEQSYCIIHKDHPLYKKPFTVRDLLEYKILYMPSDFRGALPLEELEQKYGIHVKETFVSSRFDLLKNMAERNQGIFIIPECGMYPISPEVEYVPFPDSSYTWDVYATIKADNTNPSAKLFYDFCCGL